MNLKGWFGLVGWFVLILLIEFVGFGDVRANLTVTKEPFQMEFKDGLSHMEKLLVRKYRRYC